MRMAASQALHHCSQRSAFGRLLVDQPLMQNVLADLALESEAALALTMRIARARWTAVWTSTRIVWPACAPRSGNTGSARRVASHAVEAMECIGGSGGDGRTRRCRAFSENRRSNAIWEGSGNVQCLGRLAGDPQDTGRGAGLLRRSGRGHAAVTRRSTAISAN